MASIQTSFRVTYSDTDQMGFMHHSNYFKYYETARWELFRNIGIPYSELEEEGIILPVTEASMKFIKPVLFDQTVTVKTSVKLFKGARIVFEYKAYNEAGENINVASVTVACVGKKTGKACFPPKKLTNTLKELL